MLHTFMQWWRILCHDVRR